MLKAIRLLNFEWIKLLTGMVIIVSGITKKRR